MKYQSEEADDATEGISTIDHFVDKLHGLLVRNGTLPPHAHTHTHQCTHAHPQTCEEVKRCKGVQRSKADGRASRLKQRKRGDINP